MRGGYHMVDFHNIDMTTEQLSTGVEIPGVFESIEGSYYKPILITNVTLDNTERIDTFVNVVVDGMDYKFTAYGKDFKVSQDDLVTEVR